MSMNDELSISESQQQLIVHTDPDDPSENVDGVEQLDQSQSEVERQSGLVGPGDLPKSKVLAYALGHFYNDLCASMWFTYLLIFLEKVVNLLSWQSGMLMLIGQITDGISTPLVGLLSDHSFLPGFLVRFGRRKSWHIIGTFCVTLSFPLIFSGCLLCTNFKWLHVVWFIPPIMIFQFGWASVQISHLAMIPELTQSEHTRMSMTSYRYGFTVAANLTIFAILYLFLSTDGQTTAIGPSDLSTFRNLGLITVGFGLFVTGLFYTGINEPSSGQRRLSRLNSESGSNQLERMAWHNWFSHIHFFQTGALYLFARVYINISQIYFSFYITQTQSLHKQFVALLPLTTYVSSFFVSFLIGSSQVNKRINGKPFFIVGTLIGIANCIVLFLAKPNWPIQSLVLYGIAILLGLTQAVLLICSLNSTASLINLNTESGAFVYGAMSFLDKTSNGVIVQLVELFNPSCKSSPSHDHSIACSVFYRDVMTFIPGGCVIGILIVLLTMDMSGLGQRDRRREIPQTVDNFESPDSMEETSRS